MAKVKGGSVDTESIESWFFRSAVSTKDCSMEKSSGKELCPGYYKALALAADWHVVTIFFIIVLTFFLVGMALEKRD